MRTRTLSTSRMRDPCSLPEAPSPFPRLLCEPQGPLEEERAVGVAFLSASSALPAMATPPTPPPGLRQREHGVLDCLLGHSHHRHPAPQHAALLHGPLEAG